VKLVAVTSGKGGTGSSCVAAYTAQALAKSGFSVLLVEWSSGFRALDLICGASTRTVYDMGDVVAGRAAPEDAIVKSDLALGMHLLPGALDSSLNSFSGLSLKGILNSMKWSYDFIVVDGIGFCRDDIRLFNSVILVTTPDCLSVRACAMKSAELLAAKAKGVRLIINRVPPKVMPMQGIRDFDDIIDQIGVQLIGVIPESPKLQVSSNNSQPLDEDSLTIKVFDNIAARLNGKTRPLLVR